MLINNLLGFTSYQQQFSLVKLLAANHCILTSPEFSILNFEGFYFFQSTWGKGGAGALVSLDRSWIRDVTLAICFYTCAQCQCTIEMIVAEASQYISTAVLSGISGRWSVQRINNVSSLDDVDMSCQLRLKFYPNVHLAMNL